MSGTNGNGNGTAVNPPAKPASFFHVEFKEVGSVLMIAADSEGMTGLQFFALAKYLEREGQKLLNLAEQQQTRGGLALPVMRPPGALRHNGG